MSIFPFSEGELREKLKRVEDNISMGLPVPKNTRFRLIKRLTARLTRFLTYRQRAYNEEVYLLLSMLLDKVDSNIMDLRGKTEYLLRELQEFRVIFNLGMKQAFLDQQDYVSQLRSELNHLIRRINDDRTEEVLRKEVENVKNLIASVEEKLRLEFEEIRKTIDSEIRYSKQKELAFGEAVHDLRMRASELLAAHSQLESLMLATETKNPLLSVKENEQSRELFDYVYPALEDYFRGSRDLIKKRLTPYLDDILKLNPDLPVLDIGSGRGEWLELLQNKNIKAYGVELNPHFVKRSTELGLNVYHADAISHLSTIAPGSLSAITAFQVIEHLSFEQKLALLKLSMSALTRGGMIILETPNPANIVVSTEIFWLDPTHTAPVHPALLQFLLQLCGFTRIELRGLGREEDKVLRLNYEDLENFSRPVADFILTINDRFSASADYAIIGFKP